jgi:hypothetical protein
LASFLFGFHLLLKISDDGYDVPVWSFKIFYITYPHYLHTRISVNEFIPKGIGNTSTDCFLIILYEFYQSLYAMPGVRVTLHFKAFTSILNNRYSSNTAQKQK